MSTDLADFMPEPVPEDGAEPVSLGTRAVSHHAPFVGTELAFRLRRSLRTTFDLLAWRALLVCAVVLLTATVWLLSTRASVVPQTQPQVSVVERPSAVPLSPVESAPVPQETTLEQTRSPAPPGAQLSAAPSPAKTTATQARPMSKSAPPQLLPRRAEVRPRPEVSTGSMVSEPTLSTAVRDATDVDAPDPTQNPSAAATESAVVRSPRDASEVPAAIVYSVTDSDVAPPVQIYPRFAEATARASPNALPVEVVINESGRVESAVLGRRPTSIGEAVTGTIRLGAAKRWRFRPATKDGQPVKYRRIVWFSGQ